MFRSSDIAVTIIQYTTTLLSLIALYYFNFSALDIFLIVFFYFCYCGIGIGMMFHRYWTHRTFTFNSKILNFVFGSLSILAGRGSPLGWVYIHRCHHAYSDTEKDPHSPLYAKFKIFVPSMLKLGEDFNIRIVKDMLSQDHRKINNYYNIIIASFILFLSLISIKVLFVVWIIPVALTAWAMSISTYVTHKYGYTNFAARDNSRNNLFFGYFMFGEGWHNNHHKNPGLHNNRVKFWEVDIIGYIIEILEIFKLVKIKNV